MKTYLVVPTVRNLSFLDSWGNEFSDCHLIIVEDHPRKEIKIPHQKFLSIHHFCWEDIDGDLGKDAWIISRRNAGIRCYGFLKAYQLGAEVIITLDDDCYPAGKDFVRKHQENLSLKSPEGWFTSYPHSEFYYTRGFPYKIRNKYPVVLSHGLWNGAIDLDAQTEARIGRVDIKPLNYPLRFFLPKDYFFPMCSMNLAFRREITPLMYFPLMGKNWSYDRFDDIWAGIFVKKILDHLNLSVVSGRPFINHQKASKINANLESEKKGIKDNEWFWKKVEKVQLKSKMPKDCYLELSQKIAFPKKEYFQKLRQAMAIWANLF